MAVQFRLLGDVEVLVDGTRIDVGHARQRCVLVALLIDVNHAVSAERLIDRVWADEPPHRARNAIAGYLSRLRTALSVTDEVEIVRGPGGYVLKADPTTVDVHRYRGLVAEARAASSPAAATDLFEHALGLWRGDPFATLDTPWINDHRRSLELERLSVVLDRNDAALQAGRHSELLADLTAAVHANPLDERLAGQLMLALYRSGRQAEALDTYRQMRDRLVEELGVDPSASLRAVHEQLLEGDQVRPPETPSAPSVSQVVLPRRATSFIGRQQELSMVSEALRDGPLVTLTGVGGVGKTRLALEAAAGERDRFRDGVWLCELAPVEDAAAVGFALAAALRLQQRQGLDIESTIIEYLCTRELLLVVDNCEHVLDAAAHVVDRIVKNCPRVSVLATSRESLGVEGERIVAVPPMELADATALFADRAKAGRPDFDLDREPVGAVAEICRQVDGLPLAIELAAARIRSMGSLDLARRLDGLRLLSGGARGASPRQQSLAATIDWSYRLLSEREQSPFTRLSVFAGGFDLEAAHGVCGADRDAEEDTLELLSSLVDKSMVTMRAGATTARYWVLETLRAYGRERLEAAGGDDRCHERHAQYYTALAERTAAGMHGPDEQAWVERTLPDFGNLRVAFEYAITDSHVDLAYRLVSSLSELGHLRVGYEASGWAERLLRVAEPDHPLFPAVLGFAARGAWNQGDHDRVRALATLADGRDPARGNGRVAYLGDVLADVALYEGDPQTALAHYETEMKKARRDDDPIRLVWTLFYIAICQSALRTPEKGLAAAEEAVWVSDETGNPTARSMARYALGLVLKKSEPDRALTVFDEAAELASSVQNFWWEGIALMEAAATRAVHGEPSTAANDLIAVLDHWDRVGDWSQQWLNLRYATRFLKRVGAADDALALHRALIKAGRASPLASEQTESDSELVAAPSGVEAVLRARAALGRYC